MKKLLYALIFINIVLLHGCDKDEAKKDCGCDSEVTGTIPESENLIGTVYYSSQVVPNGYIFKDQFFIEYIEINCSNCIHYMIICNENILPSPVLELKNDSTQQRTIRFAGHLKAICENLFAPSDYTYENIVLTKIEVQ